jgi:predicted dienelactone hydrolase
MKGNLAMLRCLLAFVCLAMTAAAPAAAQTLPAAPAITLEQARADDPGHAPITFAIWSPSNPPAGSVMPLIVISHGTGAGAISHVDTAQALAAAGFVVVAPMHPGDNFQDQGSVGRPQWLVDRSRHVSRVIDYMFTQWEGRGHLAANRVGIFGFSAGATTALIAIGGEPNLESVAAHCARQREFACDIMVAPAAPSEPLHWTHDSRIAAAVVAAPGLGFTFEPSGLANVRVPVQLWAGSQDQTVPYETNTAIVRRLLARRAEYHEVQGAVHLSFLAPCSAGTPPPLCQDAEGFDRAAFHARFNQAVVAFFRSHLG